MKYLFVSGFCLFFSFSVQSQDLKKIIKRNCNRNVSEVYQVRRIDDSTKEGLYQQFFCFISNNIKDYVFDHEKQQELVSEMGYYKNGKKDSFWTKKAMPGVIDEQGFYKEGKKTGIWKKIKKSQGGYIHEYFDYSNIIEQNPEKIIELAYPARTDENNIEGDVLLSFHVYRNCSIDNLKVINSQEGCEEDAKRKINRLYELKKRDHLQCEDKTIIERVLF